MKISIKSLFIGIATFVMPLTLASGTALAALGGQIEGGDIYRVRNVTQNSDFMDPATANKCETVQFKVRIHNPGPNPLTGVKVSATLPSASATSHSSQMTVTADNSDPKTTSDTAAVKLPAAYKISYVAGSTQLLDANNGLIQTLADGIVGGQVSVPGGVGVSTQQKRFVQFSAKVECPTPPLDVCPNIDGVQTSVPAGYEKDANGNCVKKPVVSTAECKATEIKISDNRKVSVTVSTTVNNATIVGYKVDFGDGTIVNSQTAEHTYAKDGTYRVVASVEVKYADGTTKWITADGCAKNVTISTPVPGEKCKIAGKENLESTDVNCKSVVTTVTPTALPDTGAGSVAAIFGSVSALATLAYSIVSRRLSRQ